MLVKIYIGKYYFSHTGKKNIYIFQQKGFWIPIFSLTSSNYKEVYESKLLQNQDCLKRFNNEINIFIFGELESTKRDIEFSLDDIAWDMEKVNDDIQYDRSINDNTFVLEIKEKLFKLRRERSRLRKVLRVVNSKILKYE